MVESSPVQTEVARIRRQAGLTQRELAELSGVAQPNIAGYESGTRRPSEAMLNRLRQAARPQPSLVLAEKRDAVRRIALRHKGVEVRVFGSVARGADRPGSDLDLLVRFDEGASLFDQVGLSQELEDLLGVKVDVVSEGGLGPRHEEIRREAVPL